MIFVMETLTKFTRIFKQWWYDVEKERLVLNGTNIKKRDFSFA
jgi:hypothetical protein